MRIIMRRLLPFKGLKPMKLAFASAALLILILAAPAFSSGVVTGGGGWQWVNPAVQGNTMKSLSFIDANTGWAAGSGGTILKTTDGGAHWVSQIPSATCMSVTGSGCNLNAVSFVDASNGWAAGDYGTIWRTSNGGSSWTAKTLPATGCGGSGSCAGIPLEDAHFFNSTTGVAVASGYAFGTRDGGENWTKVGVITTSDYLTSVQMVDASNAFAVGNTGVIYKITWTGSAWTATRQAASLTTQDLMSVFFTDAGHGWAIGGDKLLRTTDGGVNWEMATIPGAPQLWGVTMSGNSLVVTGNGGAILKRTAAANWTDPIATVASGLAVTASGTTSQLLAVAFAGGSTTAYASGTAGAITKTIDGGANWSLTAGGNDKTFSGSSFINDMTGWMVANDGSVIKTTDAGASWANDSSGIAAGTNLRAVQFLDANTGFTVGYSGSAGVAYKYSSGTWSAMTVPANVAQLWGVHMTSATTGWAVGMPPRTPSTPTTPPGPGPTIALKTTDGSNWVLDNAGFGNDIDLYGVDSTGATNGWVVGQNVTTGKGVVASYSGGTWTVTEKTDSTTLISIDIVDGTIGYLAGYVSPGTPPNWADGKVYKTTDGGASWNPMPSLTTGHLMDSVSFIDTATGYVAGDGGRVFRTANGGTNWTVESLGTTVGMTTVSVVRSSLAPPSYSTFVGGGNAALLRQVGRDYLWTWYDNFSSGALNWVLMGNPSSATRNLAFNLSIAGANKDLSGFNNGVVPPGQSITPQYNGVIGGPVDATSVTGGKGIVSQRILWAGNSLEEVVGTDAEKLSSHFWWTWYDEKSPGFLDWVLVANPNDYPVYYEIKVAGATPSSWVGDAPSGTIPPGHSVTPRFPGTMEGPVEVEAWTDSGKGTPAKVMASQRVLSNGGSAFNEVPGIPAAELSDEYYWTWYDQKSAGAVDWVLVANPSATDTVRAEVSFTDRDSGLPVTGTYDLAPGQQTTPTYPGKRGGPVKVKAYLQGDPGQARRVIASQRSLWGPSFEEVPGYPSGSIYNALSSSYHWTWYDQLAAGVGNWVLMANPASATDTIKVEVWMNGVRMHEDNNPAKPDYWVIAPGESKTPTFGSYRGGPVEVRAYRDGGAWPADARPVIASQRVLWNGFFNEVLGTVLN